jgi:hypothetical protein
MKTIREPENPLKKAFEPLLTFDCTVNGNELKGFFYGETDEDPINRTIDVGFSDGYQTTFLVDENGYWHDLNDNKSPYVIPILTDLNILLSHRKDRFATCFPVEDVEGLFNVYVFECEDEVREIQYAVYYKNDYRFTLKKNKGKWDWSTSRKINPEIMNEPLKKFTISKIEERMK